MYPALALQKLPTASDDFSFSLVWAVAVALLAGGGGGWGGRVVELHAAHGYCLVRGCFFAPSAILPPSCSHHASHLPGAAIVVLLEVCVDAQVSPSAPQLMTLHHTSIQQSSSYSSLHDT
jgi:hypothetical protein